MFRITMKEFLVGAILTAMVGANTVNAVELHKLSPPTPKDISANKDQSKAFATLSFSDNKQSITDLKEINNILHTVGVHLSQVAIPKEAAPILTASSTSKLDAKQQSKILKMFSLSRKDLLNQIQLAGRKPVIAGGGSLSTQEKGVPPYPKIYDLKSMSAQNFIDAQNKFGKLHVNFAENGQGVDEVMTLISGGPWTWFFLLKNNVVAKLNLPRIPANASGWRMSYPGLTPHGAFMAAEDGICVAYISGPKTWLMHYEAPKLEGAQMLGTNPWIDFSNKQPILLDKIQSAS